MHISRAASAQSGAAAPLQPAAERDDRLLERDADQNDEAEHSEASGGACAGWRGVREVSGLQPRRAERQGGQHGMTELRRWGSAGADSGKLALRRAMTASVTLRTPQRKSQKAGHGKLFGCAAGIPLPVWFRP